MGVYLAAPIKEKNIKQSNNKPFPYISAEMQGTLTSTKDGEKLWKMQSYTNPILVKALAFSLSSTDTEVTDHRIRFRSESVCQ